VIPPRDPHVTDPAEAKRLSRQCQAILDLFRSSLGNRVSNWELAAISLKYTGRISDLRAAGYTINIVERNRETGLTVYHYPIPACGVAS